ncbi:hypothetical protein P879_11980 [Paragonimus westermani]|uniref:Uncharacterized protein n=1 Tax=Paragonimus westermani TaxID=34504 RepID=A0A8T0D7W9_9TREM|nr:hypothetical protein P879_11980 [Paragonimus westermani]
MESKTRYLELTIHHLHGTLRARMARRRWKARIAVKIAYEGREQGYGPTRTTTTCLFPIPLLPTIINLPNRAPPTTFIFFPSPFSTGRGRELCGRSKLDHSCSSQRFRLTEKLLHYRSQHSGCLLAGELCSDPICLLLTALKLQLAFIPFILPTFCMRLNICLNEYGYRHVTRALERSAPVPRSFDVLLY